MISLFPLRKIFIRVNFREENPQLWMNIFIIYLFIYEFALADHKSLRIFSSLQFQERNRFVVAPCYCLTSLLVLSQLDAKVSGPFTCWSYEWIAASNFALKFYC